mgnify:CR=1 FL=1
MNELDLPKQVSREQIDRLQAEMVKMPQAELVTEHFFSPGMYCRRVFRPAGTLIVGKVHKQPHFFLCAKGEIIAWTENGMKKLQAGDVVESKPGTKRITLATQDSIGITVHKTDKTDLDDIEAELIEPDETALFDSGNKLKQIVSEMKKLSSLPENVKLKMREEMQVVCKHNYDLFFSDKFYNQIIDEYKTNFDVAMNKIKNDTSKGYWLRKWQEIFPTVEFEKSIEVILVEADPILELYTMK